MHRKRTWTITFLALAGMWVGLVFGMRGLQALEPTPDKVAAFAEQLDPDALPTQERDAAIDELTEQVRRLPAWARTDPRLIKRMRVLFNSMTPEQRQRYITATLPQGMEQMITALNQMPPERRQKLVEQAMEQLEASEGEELPIDAETLQRLIDQGMEVYLRDASDEAKLDLQPLIQRMQERMRSGRPLERLDRRRDD